MILGTLKLNNFSAYAGEQSIDLAPPQSDRPIILIGGLNGAGKTSLLTAVCLTLFGKRAIQFTETGSNYSGLLRDLIHDKAKPQCSVELTFYTYTLGERDTYRVRRSWTLTSNGKVEEELTAWKNDAADEVLASTWDDFIDSFLPASIAHLFFFDGEKVADMANADGARTLLRTGVQSLLGIDLLSRLQDDLADLISRKVKPREVHEEADRLAHLEADIAELLRQQADLDAERITLEAHLEQQRATLEKIETRFRSTGAHLFLERRIIEQEKIGAQQDLSEINDALVELAAGALPLAQAPALLKEVKLQVQKEQAAQDARTVLKILESRDARLLALLTEINANTRSRVKTFLATDRSERSATAGANIYLNMTKNACELLKNLESLLEVEKGEAKALIIRRAEAETRLDDAKRRLAMVPAEETVADVITEREEQLRVIQKSEDALASLQRKYEHCEQALTFRRVERERKLRHIAKDQSEDTIEARVVRYAQKARDRVTEFSGKMLQHSLAHLEALILESIQILFRKTNLICGVSIDNDTFTLLLRDDLGQPLPLDRFSAGERQLVIIAILWGLGRASGRPLPLIVDTPLGRLDSTHRVKLLENYFPTASHQVILLTTDTEINSEDLAQLNPYLGGSYLLSYDNKAKRSRIQPGYFWS